MEQKKDHSLTDLLTYLKTGTLSREEHQACKVVVQASLFAIKDDVLYYLDHKRKSRKHAVFPDNLKEKIIRSTHGGPLAGHFSNNGLYNLLARS